jgi:hypothetical protein
MVVQTTNSEDADIIFTETTPTCRVTKPTILLCAEGRRHSVEVRIKRIKGVKEHLRVMTVTMAIRHIENTIRQRKAA